MIARNFAGPLPNVGFPKQVASVVLPPFTGVVSGEVTDHRKDMPLGMARYAGRVTGVYMSVGACGKDDASANCPRVSGEVYINGTTVLSVKPKIGAMSGEASQQKTTFAEAADTGCVAAVLTATAANRKFAPGDVLTWEIIYGGSSSPTTKLRSVAILVEVDPD